MLAEAEAIGARDGAPASVMADVALCEAIVHTQVEDGEAVDNAVREARARAEPIHHRDAIAWCDALVGVRAEARGDVETLRQAGEHILHSTDDVREPFTRALGVHHACVAAALEGDPGPAVPPALAELEHSQKTASASGVAVGCVTLAVLSLAEGDTAAVRTWAEPLHIPEVQKWAWLAWNALHPLLRAALAEGDVARARDLGGELLALAERVGNRRARALALLGLGRAALIDGELSAAEPLVREALDELRAGGWEPGAADAVEVLGAVQAARGDWPEAARSLEAAAAARARLGIVRIPREPDVWDTLAERARHEMAAN